MTGVTAEELERAKEHVKGRMVLGIEATAARMSRLARSILFDVPLLSLDEMLERVEAVTDEDVAALVTELYDPERLSAACIGPQEELFREAERLGQRGAGRGVIRVGVSGAAGRMGQAVCEAVEGADDMELVGPCGSLARDAVGRRAGGQRRGRGLHDAGCGAGKRPRVRGRGRTRGGRDHRLRPGQPAG